MIQYAFTISRTPLVNVYHTHLMSGATSSVHICREDHQAIYAEHCCQCANRPASSKKNGDGKTDREQNKDQRFSGLIYKLQDPRGGQPGGYQRHAQPSPHISPDLAERKERAI
jgi:hypothetical protein